jgi:hypothetical protein
VRSLVVNRPGPYLCRVALLDDLLCRGYFPDKIPPPFTTQPFGLCIQANFAALPAEFSQPRVRELEHYDLGRAGQLRRRLSMPHPISYYRLASEIDSAWTDIQNHLAGSLLSLSVPIAGPADGRALVPTVDFGDLPEHRPLKRNAGRMLLRTDIANFYSSIYTHSIPWALHTKAVAKANRSSTLLGNRLDKLVQDSQFGQTKGIPVGPDTSLVIAEILLASVDSALLAAHPALVGLRHMDDYEIACRSRTDAEETLASLQTHASEFELQLNGFKTEIVELPTPSMDEWTRTLSSFGFRETIGQQKRDLLDYFDAVFALARRFPSRSVTAYALRRLAAEELLLDNWEPEEALTVQAAVGEPDALPQALEVLLANEARGAVLNGALLSKALNGLVLEHAPLGHHSEVAWSIWASLALQYQLSEDATRALSRVDNSTIALLALDARAQGALHPTLDTRLWEQHMTGDELHGPHWLISYEANFKGWLPSVGGDHVAADAAFSFLKSHDVYFYEQVDSESALDALRGFLRQPSTYGAGIVVNLEDDPDESPSVT